MHIVDVVVDLLSYKLIQTKCAFFWRIVKATSERQNPHSTFIHNWSILFNIWQYAYILEFSTETFKPTSDI